MAGAEGAADLGIPTHVSMPYLVTPLPGYFSDNVASNTASGEQN